MISLMERLMILILPAGVVVLSLAANRMQYRRDDPSSELGTSLVLVLGAALVAPLAAILLLSSLWQIAWFW